MSFPQAPGPELQPPSSHFTPSLEGVAVLQGSGWAAFWASLPGGRAAGHWLLPGCVGSLAA